MDDLPPLYARWMREVTSGDLPREQIATCRTCVMLPAAGDAPAVEHFNAATKCCTFLPELHNFLVGGVLDDVEAHPVGKASVERRIDEGVMVTPLGLGRPRSYLLVYEEAGGNAYGRARALRCPHYVEDDGGICGVWRHRDSTCATWFCKHNRGARGNASWRTIQRLLGVVEQNLAWWCVRELGLDVASVAALLEHRAARKRPKVTASDLDRHPDGEHSKLWGTWSGREREFYRACASRVATLAWADVLAIGGPDLALAADVVRATLEQPPADVRTQRLVPAPFSVLSIRGEAAMVTTYNGYDPLSIPLALLEALDAFDGRPTREVLEALARDRALELEPELVTKLADFEVLKPAS